MSIWILLLVIYLAVLLGDKVGKYLSNFMPAKGLWKLVPFRVSGWKSSTQRNRIYRIKWAWQMPDFDHWEEK